jgi:hypothetical protein
MSTKSEDLLEKAGIDENLIDTYSGTPLFESQVQVSPEKKRLRQRYLVNVKTQKECTSHHTRGTRVSDDDYPLVNYYATRDLESYSLFVTLQIMKSYR